MIEVQCNQCNETFVSWVSVCKHVEASHGIIFNSWKWFEVGMFFQASDVIGPLSNLMSLHDVWMLSVQAPGLWPMAKSTEI